VSVATVARRYATALADVVVPSGEALKVQSELAEWAKLLDSNPLLKEVIGNPTIPYDQKQKMLLELIQRTRVSTTTANFLQILLKNQRLLDLPEINTRFVQVLDERAGVVSAQVTTARPVSEAIKLELDRQVSHLTGKRVRLNFATDEELIGGIVTRIGSTIYDGSIKNQLEEAKEKLAGTTILNS
jgi:F-type H+-transporting ATPase subunit delta